MRLTTTTTRAAFGTVLLAGLTFAHTAATAGMFKSSPCNVPALRESILQQVNAVRARGYNCGGQAFGAARPVSWNNQLHTAADVHSRDMADNNYFSHKSLSGTRAYQRVEAQGYKWADVGENIAAGDFDVRGVMQGWLDSPSHCKAIMEPAYAEMAVSCASRPGTTYGNYWTLVLARR
jgi:uncharacterized protein YkwD